DYDQAVCDQGSQSGGGAIERCRELGRPRVRTTLATPLLREGIAIGGILIRRVRAGEPVGDDHRGPRRSLRSWIGPQRAMALYDRVIAEIGLPLPNISKIDAGHGRSGEQHPSFVLYGRLKGRRVAVYVPEELVPEVRRGLDNGHALQNCCSRLRRATSRR